MLVWNQRPVAIALMVGALVSTAPGHAGPAGPDVLAVLTAAYVQAYGEYVEARAAQDHRDPRTRVAADQALDRFHVALRRYRVAEGSGEAPPPLPIASEVVAGANTARAISGGVTPGAVGRVTVGGTPGPVSSPGGAVIDTWPGSSGRPPIPHRPPLVPLVTHLPGGGTGGGASGWGSHPTGGGGYNGPPGSRINPSRPTPVGGGVGREGDPIGRPLPGTPVAAGGGTPGFGAPGAPGRVGPGNARPSGTAAGGAGTGGRTPGSGSIGVFPGTGR